MSHTHDTHALPDVADIVLVTAAFFTPVLFQFDRHSLGSTDQQV